MGLKGLQQWFSQIADALKAAPRLWQSIQGGAGFKGPVSDHFDGKVFANANAQAQTARGFADFVRWQRTAKRKVWPRWVTNRAQPTLPVTLLEDQVALTFINHITFLIQCAGLNVLTDPVYSQRVSPVQWGGPQRVRAPGLAFADLPPIHLVLLSHNHYDHLDLNTLRQLERAHAPLIVTTLGNADFLRAQGLSRVVELDWWQRTTTGAAEVILTPAQHWSGRGIAGRNRTLWGGFVLRVGGVQIYFAGDTGYWSHFSEVRERFGAIDVALLPIGAYAPRWFMQDAHMDPDDAVRAHLDLQAKVSIATHFGCFQLTDEGIDEPLFDLNLALTRHAVAPSTFLALEVGETRVLSCARVAQEISA